MTLDYFTGMGEKYPEKHMTFKYLQKWLDVHQPSDGENLSNEESSDSVTRSHSL